jgi:hypothetical protein
MMKRGFSILMGVVLILLGGLALAFNFFAPILLPEFLRWGTWRLWPLIVVCGGLFLVVPPFLVRGKRGLGGLFIAGVPILATGGILFYTSLFERWGDWEALWPIEVLALAFGFLCAAIYMRVIWLLLPAIFLGANGAIFQFCALTELWELWAVLWALEPLSIGLAFLLINLKQRAPGLFVAGMILCVIGAMGLMGMSALFPGLWLIHLMGPAAFLFSGLVLLIWGLTRRSAQPENTEAAAG